MDPDGREEQKALSFFKDLGNRIIAILKKSSYELYTDISVGAGISANVVGIGAGADIGSEHAKISLQGSFTDEKSFDMYFDYQEYMSIGIETPIITVTGETPTPAEIRSFTSRTQKEAPPGVPITNMKPSYNIGPVSISKDSITIKGDIGAQAVIGIEFGLSVTIPFYLED